MVTKNQYAVMNETMCSMCALDGVMFLDVEVDEMLLLCELTKSEI